MLYHSTVYSIPYIPCITYYMLYMYTHILYAVYHILHTVCSLFIYIYIHYTYSIVIYYIFYMLCTYMGVSKTQGNVDPK